MRRHWGRPDEVLGALPAFLLHRFLPIAALGLLVLGSCSAKGATVTVAREQLFAIGYGPAEDQIDLFQVKGNESLLKTRLVMRDGVFYLSNGNAAKLVRFSSFGDVLSLIYNPESNPEPTIQMGSAGEKTGRLVSTYPFRAPGELAVDSSNMVYVEDRMPPERRIYDKDTGTLFDYAVFRFGKDGNYEDYLGQEGIGGTPFPYILGLYSTSGDDLVVVSVMQDSWLVHWFDSRGGLRNSLKIPRTALPKPGGDEGLLASLDRVVPDSAGRFVVMKVDYSREIVDSQTKSYSGIDYAGSWLYRMDVQSGTVTDRWEIPAVQEASKSSEALSGRKYSIVPEFLGVAGDRFFFVTIDEDSHTSISVLNRLTKSLERYAIEIAPDELYFNTMTLSKEGVISALLGTKYEARIVWWRFDKLVGFAGGGSR
jgi:hypothetical protein